MILGRCTNPNNLLILEHTEGTVCTVCMYEYVVQYVGGYDAKI